VSIYSAGILAVGPQPPTFRPSHAYAGTTVSGAYVFGRQRPRVYLGCRHLPQLSLDPSSDSGLVRYIFPRRVTCHGVVVGPPLWR